MAAPLAALGALGAAAPRRNVRSRVSPRRSRVAARAVESNASPPARLEGEKLEKYMARMAEDLTHLFDEQGIDKDLYEADVSFEDPLTKYDDIDGYLFNIGMLKNVFRPVYTMHSIEQTGDWELSTRWTMNMSLPKLPFFWGPELTFTGTSVMGINPATMRVSTHFDTWDAIQTQGFFLKTGDPGGVAEVLRQIFDFTLQPDLETPEYVVLRRYADYEVREYEPFLVAETNTGGRLGAGAMTGRDFNPFGALAGYIFGGNETGEKMAMTTPVYTSEGKMQFVMSRRFRDASALPKPKEGSGVSVSERPGGIFAAARFAGVATDDLATEAERRLVAATRRDGHVVKSGVGASLAQYNDPATNPLRRRNDVLVELEGFDKGRLDK